MPDEIQVFGLRDLKIDKLKLPGNWREILASPEATDRGISIANVGMIQNPVVRKSDKLLICGAYRVAGVVLQGGSKVTVKLVECSDEQVEAMRLDENIERRHDPDMQRTLREKRMAELTKANTETPTRDDDGRIVSPQRAARKQLAKELGITPKSLRQAEWRARKASKEVGAVDEAPIIHLRGMELDTQYLEQVAIVMKHIAAAKKKALGAVNHFSQILKLGVPFSQEAAKGICEQLTAISWALGREMPFSVCPYCRCLGGVVADCVTCHSTGWVTAVVIEETTPDLLDDEHPRILYRDVVITVEDYVGPAPPDEPDEPDEAGEGDLADLWTD